MSTAPESACKPAGTWADGVKVTVFLKKQHGMTDEQFSQYYAHVHAALAGPILLRHGCISYTQLHCLNGDKANASIACLFGPDALSAESPMQLMPYDACSSFVFADLQGAQGFYNDPETLSILAADSLNFTNPATMQVAIGHEFVVIQNAEPQQT
ncbi:uncharacterized protein SRS1_16593 [Sporisorium reilianum f. sp. reilianum]|uniref:EthD domain-containing protein n=1 Tax=Sporisorium reilianum f. sp. reilianum TaxID=72559 RepID=A0A2N8UCH3_9BASI|nr:uncharacterized protein SRS1_16593 [Sporisorium reilianum f. sp. reilianum]